MRTLMVVGIALSGAAVASLVAATHSGSRQGTAPRPPPLLEQVEDATRFKVLWMDSVHNLLGLGWEDRERNGIGRSATSSIITRIAGKYGFAPPSKETDFEEDYSRRVSGGGTPQAMYLMIPDVWLELYHLENWGRLPAVKYRSGTIFVALKTWTVSFSEGTRLQIASDEYVFTGGSLQRQADQASPRPPQEPQPSLTQAVTLSESYASALFLRLLTKAGIQPDKVSLQFAESQAVKGAYTLRAPSKFGGVVAQPARLREMGCEDVTEGDRVEIQDLGREEYRVQVTIARSGLRRILDLR